MTPRSDRLKKLLVDYPAGFRDPLAVELLARMEELERENLELLVEIEELRSET